jgi:hypothetical protein
MTASFAAMALGCLISSTAFAGIVDSPLPVLMVGKKTLHVYSVPNVINHYGTLETFFGCTSTDTATIQVGVETFPSLGGDPDDDAVATSLSVAPGATVTFGTYGAAGISTSSTLGGTFSKGSARILATSKKLICTAWVADAGSAPPATSWQLTIVKKTTQKGD